jgi:hypothetical protein
VECRKAKFPLTPSFVKSTTAGRPALSPAEREDRQRLWDPFWFQPNSTAALVCAVGAGGLSLLDWASAAEGGGISDVAFIECDIFFGQVGGIEQRVALAEVEFNVKIEFFRRNGGTKLFE